MRHAFFNTKFFGALCGAVERKLKIILAVHIATSSYVFFIAHFLRRDWRVE